jgi:putative redox protein
MAKKTVSIETSMEKGFKLVSQLGNHTMVVDQPTAGGGTDAGPNPLQYFMLSLAGCISAIARIAATQKKITLRSIKLTVQGELDTDALMGVSQDVRSGFGAIEVTAEINADLSDEEKRAFLEEVDARCPISENIAKITPVSIRLGE